MSHAERSTERISQAALEACMKTKNAKESVAKLNYWLELGCKCCILYRVNNLQIVIFSQCNHFCDMLFNILLYNIKDLNRRRSAPLLNSRNNVRTFSQGLDQLPIPGGGGGGILPNISYIGVCGPKEYGFGTV